MLQATARYAIEGPRSIIIAALLVMVGAGVFGAPVMDHLSGGGFRNSHLQSWDASQLMANKFGQGDMQLILSISSDTGAHSEAARAVAADLVAELETHPLITQVHSAWVVPPATAKSMLSNDGKTGLIVAGRVRR